VEAERAFSATGNICHKTQKQPEWWECAFIVMRQCYKHHSKTVHNLNSLINCAGTNNSNFTMIPSSYRSKSHSFQNQKKGGFPGCFSQIPETRVLKFCPELETLVTTTLLIAAFSLVRNWRWIVCKPWSKQFYDNGLFSSSYSSQFMFWLILV